MPDKQQKRRKYLTIKQYSFLRSVCKMFCYSIFRMKVSGLENVPRSGPIIILSNHQSFLDPIFVGTPIARPIRFVARDTLYTSKFFSNILKKCMVIPIKRGTADMGAIKEILRSMNDGYGVAMFPEATRTTDGMIKDIKPGFGLLARKSRAAIVPTVIEGAFECWPRNRKLFLPGEIIVCYGKPITADMIASMNDDDFAKAVTDSLRTMQNNCRKIVGKQPFDYK